MRSHASILKPQGKGKWMHFIPLIKLGGGNRVYSSVHPTPLVQDTELGQELCRGQKKICKNLPALQLLGRWSPLLKRACPAHSSKENQQQPYTGERTQICGAQVGADARAGLLEPRGRISRSPAQCFLGRFWSHPDIPNLPHRLYRMLNSVSRDKHIFLQEVSWIMTKLDNFAIFAAPSRQTQLYK